MLGRPADQRKAMLRGLTTQLIREGRVTTTKARAKALGSPSWKRRQSSSGMLMGPFYGFSPPCRKECPYSARATQATSTRTPRGKAFTAIVARAG